MRRSSRLTTARCVAFLTLLSQRRRRSDGVAVVSLLLHSTSSQHTDLNTAADAAELTAAAHSGGFYRQPAGPTAGTESQARGADHQACCIDRLTAAYSVLAGRNNSNVRLTLGMHWSQCDDFSHLCGMCVYRYVSSHAHTVVWVTVWECCKDDRYLAIHGAAYGRPMSSPI